MTAKIISDKVNKFQKNIYLYKKIIIDLNMKEQSNLNLGNPSIVFQQYNKDQEVPKLKIQKITQGVSIKCSTTIKRRQVKNWVTMNDRLQAQKVKLIETFALYILIQEAYPTMFEQSVQYIFQLSRHLLQDTSFQKKFKFESIKDYFFSFYRSAFEKFYELSLQILNNRIQQIIKQYQQSPSHDSFNIRVEILGHYIKNIVEFQEYLPKNNKSDYLKPNYLVRALAIQKESFRVLKKFYTEVNRELITLFDDQTFNISVLINTYYILQLRNKCQGLSKQFRELSLSIILTPDIYLTENINLLKDCKKQRIIQNRSCNMKETSRTFSEKWALINKKQKVTYSTLSLQEIKQEEAIFKKMFKSNAKLIKRHEKIGYLVSKYNKKLTYYQNKYPKYVLKMKQYGSKSTDQLKDRFIAHRLRQDALVTYEKICKSAYHFSFIYVSRKYFDENIDRLLRKQCCIQQKNYLNQIVNLIQSEKDIKENIFLQKYLLPGQDNKNQYEKVVLFIAISASGLNYSKVTYNSPQFQKAFFCQMMNKVQKSSIILSSDPIMQLQSQSNGRTFNKYKSFFVLPCLKAHQFPNPCQIIFHLVTKFLEVLTQSNQNKDQLKLLAQKSLEMIICKCGLDILTLELEFATLRSRDQICSLKKINHLLFLQMELIEDRDSMLLYDTQGLRKYLHALKLYSTRVLNILAKSMTI